MHETSKPLALGRPCQPVILFKGWSRRLLLKNLDRLLGHHFFVSPCVEPALLLATVRRRPNHHWENRRRCRNEPHNVVHLAAVPLARSGNDGQAAPRCRASGMARLSVFCPTRKSGVFRGALFLAIRGSIADRGSRTVARGTSAGPLDSAHAVRQRDSCHRINDASRSPFCRAWHASG